MPRGAPDYSNVKVGEPLHRLTDMAELAARLGSPNVYDRSGNVVWMTDFESGLQGSGFGVDHVDSVGEVSAERSFHGDFSIKLNPRAADTAYVNWGRVMHYMIAGPVGFEYSISLDTDPDIMKTYVFYHHEDLITEASLHYYPDTGLWRVIKAGPAWHTVLEDFTLQQGGGAWHPIKLVLDLENKEYVRVQIAQHVVPLPGVAIHSYGPAGAGQLELRLQVHGSEAAHAAVYIDGIIITQNEP